MTNPLPLPSGVRARQVPNVNGLSMHVLEAGTAGQPLIVLLHGFPELAFSWRNVMPVLAQHGYRTLAPDQRGFGRTLGGSTDYETDLAPYRATSLASDITRLLDALGETDAHAVVGHDFGASVAATLALLHPDRFHRLALMSAPFSGVATPSAVAPVLAITEALAALTPPRKHYHYYYSTPEANGDMCNAPQGVHDFLRAYFHHKSGDWPENRPRRLKGWTAEALAELPTYYLMHRGDTMPETVAPFMPDHAMIAACSWLPDAALGVYSEEYDRTGFQGGLNWYRARLLGPDMEQHRQLAGRTIDVPSSFISGASDWGVYQTPGALEAMQQRACTDLRGVHLIDGVGHWVQQEAPEIVADHLLTLFG